MPRKKRPQFVEPVEVTVRVLNLGTEYGHTLCMIQMEKTIQDELQRESAPGDTFALLRAPEFVLETAQETLHAWRVPSTEYGE